ncbi:MAG: NAD(P)H-dependent oxidoreductase [Verrucomicrobiota bacterium]
MKILAFGASTSSESINRLLANYVARQIPGSEVTDLDLRSFDLPLYSVDEEESTGIPADARRFFELIQSHDALVISLAEHNGSYTAAFKNLHDWTSRIEMKLWSNKPMLLLSTSPGGRGGAAVMASAKMTYPHLGADIRATLSLPSFHENFDPDKGITDPELARAFKEATSTIEN